MLVLALFHGAARRVAMEPGNRCTATQHGLCIEIKVATLRHNLGGLRQSAVSLVEIK
jgi:hypothetical protein